MGWGALLGTGQRPVATGPREKRQQECLPLPGTNPRHKRLPWLPGGGWKSEDQALGACKAWRLFGDLLERDGDGAQFLRRACARRGQARGLSLLRQGETTGRMTHSEGRGVGWGALLGTDRKACRYLEQTHGTNGVPWLPGGGWKSECRPWGPALAEGEAWRLFATWLPAIERERLRSAGQAASAAWPIRDRPEACRYLGAGRNACRYLLLLSPP